MRKPQPTDMTTEGVDYSCCPPAGRAAGTGGTRGQGGTSGSRSCGAAGLFLAPRGAALPRATEAASFPSGTDTLRPPRNPEGRARPPGQAARTQAGTPGSVPALPQQAVARSFSADDQGSWSPVAGGHRGSAGEIRPAVAAQSGSLPLRGTRELCVSSSGHTCPCGPRTGSASDHRKQALDAQVFSSALGGPRRH